MKTYFDSQSRIMNNSTSFITFYNKEVKRFLNVWIQTIIAPAISSMLFLLVLIISIKSLNGKSQDFLNFVTPGIVMMSMMQNAFANSSSSIIVSKIQRNIVDVLMAPLSPIQLALGYVFSSITRGALVGFVVYLSVVWFTDFKIHSLPITLFYIISSCSILSLLGVIAGLYANKFDQLAVFTNFIIAPLSFLSGTFYSILSLPSSIQIIASINPFFYMIDGFRYGIIGTHDGNLLVGTIVILTINTILFVLSWCLLKKGYGLKN